MQYLQNWAKVTSHRIKHEKREMLLFFINSPLRTPRKL